MADSRTDNRNLQDLIGVLDQMIGHHRAMLEACREEKVALAEANLKGIQEKTHAKEFLVETIRGLDKKRAELCGEIIYDLNLKEGSKTLSDIILGAEDEYPEDAVKLRSQLTTLIHMVGSIQKINDQNREFLLASVSHIEEMKKNVLGEASPKADTYGNKATVQSGKNQASRLISKEV